MIKTDWGKFYSRDGWTPSMSKATIFHNKTMAEMRRLEIIDDRIIFLKNSDTPPADEREFEAKLALNRVFVMNIPDTETQAEPGDGT